ncbi:MAG: TIGR04552 family protein [Candidatus Melainabacteria bacterium]|nr:TIGR04552 family protein [Candidatus Melainabacteria bacterium]
MTEMPLPEPFVASQASRWRAMDSSSVLETEPTALEAPWVDLPWETLAALIHGVSSIDLTRMPIRSETEAYEFVTHYGYDLSEPTDRQEMEDIAQEAVAFLQQRLLPEPEPAANAIPLRMPASVAMNTDVISLILLAAQPTEDSLASERHWACAVLKVMHTLAHIRNGHRFRYFERAREQILSRFSRVLSVDEPTGQIRLGKVGPGERSLLLYGFEAKDQKSKESILIKLLCKKGHVAEQVEDLLGVRLITHTPAEALLAMEILRENKVLVFPNVIPSRSHNSLLDFNALQQAHQQAMLTGQFADWDTLHQWYAQLQITPPVETFDGHNPHSSTEYRALHLTCRQLIRIKQADRAQEERFFFPYEIQITDRANYLESQQGDSAHAIYKRRQLERARRRVLGPLLATVSADTPT